MPEIRHGRDLLTLINVFTVRPGDQDRLVDLLVDAAEQTLDTCLDSYRPSSTEISMVSA